MKGKPFLHVSTKAYRKCLETSLLERNEESVKTGGKPQSSSGDQERTPMKRQEELLRKQGGVQKEKKKKLTDIGLSIPRKRLNENRRGPTRI